MEFERLILLRVLIRILPFLFEVADLTDEAAEEVDEGERISMGTAWCRDTILALVPPCTLFPMTLLFAWVTSKPDDELLLPPIK